MFALNFQPIILAACSLAERWLWLANSFRYALVTNVFAFALHGFMNKVYILFTASITLFLCTDIFHSVIAAAFAISYFVCVYVLFLGFIVSRRSFNSIHPQ